jgi:hypothetical protein
MMLKKEEKQNFYINKYRIKPIENRFVLWPAGMTHIHRGNPPLKGEKYIATGWVEWNLIWQ